MRAWKTLNRRPTLASINVSYHKTLGHRLRDVIEYIGNKVHPFVKYIFPNFIAIHYFYIIFMIALGSILMYPVKNYAYIDILFTATGACTQGGLNTININEMTLYQQIVIYLLCCLTTPIWIHGTLAFVRLYWFERHFDGIKDWSKKNFKMRRTKTLIQREVTRTGTGMQRRPTLKNGHNDHSFTNNRDFQSKLFSGQMVNREENTGAKDNYEMNTLKENTGDQLDKKDAHASSSTVSTKSIEQGDDTPGIKFGAMPKPPKNDSGRSVAATEKFSGRRGSEDISPADMFRSIAMLRSQHDIEERDEDGPALVINGPAERHEMVTRINVPAKSNSNPAFSPIQSDATVPPSPTHSDTTVLSTLRDTNPVQMTLNNSPGSAETSSGSFSKEEDNKPVQWAPDQDNDRFAPSSIHFQDARPPPSRGRKQMFGRRSTRFEMKQKIPKKFIRSGKLRERLRNLRSETNEDGNDADMELESSDNESAEPNYMPEDLNPVQSASNEASEMSDLEKVHSNLVVPSQDATGGAKFYKRSNTMEPPGDRNLELLTKSPSFQRMIYEKWKEDRRRNGGFLRRKNSALTRSYSGFGGGREPSLGLERGQGETSDDEEALGEYAGMSFDQPLQRPPRLQRMSTNYLSYQPKIGRNSTFVGLNEVQRAELGGVEYRANKLLCRLVLVYYIGFHIMAFVMLLPWITKMKKYITLVRSDGISPAWWGFFTSMSAFNDLGLTLTPDSMMSFNKAIYPLIVMIWFIIIGNTGFPVFLRFIIWVMFKLSPELSLTKESLGFLLDHPRRCFTLLFPSAPTWWLLFILVALNVVDLILFIVLDLNSQVVEGLSSGFKVLDGLFQAVSTRTAGFSVLNLSMLHPSVQVSYMLMMYVSVLPLAISIRRTNVYEEQSLGIYHPHDENEGSDQDSRIDKSPKSFIGAHLRRQLSFDLWFLFLGLFIICISEGSKIKDPKKPDFTVFQVLFEVVSAYGTVGLSLGYPNTDQSFSAQFNTFSKVIVIFMMVRGRHRGLPYTLDRAIILPSQSLEQRDEIEDKNRENGSGNRDPLLAYLRDRSKSAEGRFKSMLPGRKSSHRQQQGVRRMHTNETQSTPRGYVRAENARSPSLRGSVNYQSSARDSAASRGEISPTSRSPHASHGNLESERGTFGEHRDNSSRFSATRSTDEYQEDDSQLSKEAPDAQEGNPARVLP
ncbi:LAME_0G05336g1_1 [Lachancea meyersii CBS 8951]|uniref:Potassium transport protein n=1 Tax=Lachancea meyersii CBS 8951 TaxID=1266667 RepID=A0A1G4K795_9SACH|nr:LAME_0G05336g1_1 [Lachancea meyersii CBS 8951]